MDFTPKLKPKLQDEIERRMCQRVQEAVLGADERDSNFAHYFSLLQGWSEIAVNPPWPGACELYDPLTREHHTSLLASITQIWSDPPYWMVKPERKELKATAQKVEAWINQKAETANLKKSLYEVAYLACAQPFAFMYVGWKQTWAKKRQVVYENVETEEIAPTLMEQEPEFSYREQPQVEQQLLYNGIEYRVPDSRDVYLYPPDAQDKDTSLAILERMWLTAEDLLRGVQELGYDEEKVMELLRFGATHSASYESSPKEERDLNDGLQPAGEDGYYETFQVIGRLPLIWDDGREKIITPEYLRDEDFLFMICPQHNIVFKFVASPFPRRPYAKFSMLPVPNRLNGDCVPTLLEALQEEATANLRTTINCMNIVQAPVYKVPEQWRQKYGEWQFWPGALIPYDRDPNEIQPMVSDIRGSMAGFELQSFIDARAQRTISAQGVNNLMGGKVRKAAEVEMTGEVVDEKNDLVMSNLQDGLQEVGELTIAVTLHFQPTLNEEIQTPSAVEEVTAYDLKEQYTLIPRVATGAFSLEARMAKAAQKQQIMQQYWATALQVPPNVLPFLWHGARESLLALDEQDVESWIGEQPMEMPEEGMGMPMPMQMPGMNPMMNGAPAMNGNGGY